MVYRLNIVYCKKAKLEHTQVPEAAYDNGSDQCAHHNLNIAQKHGKQHCTDLKTW